MDSAAVDEPSPCWTRRRALFRLPVEPLCLSGFFCRCLGKFLSLSKKRDGVDHEHRLPPYMYTARPDRCGLVISTHTHTHFSVFVSCGVSSGKVAGDCGQSAAFRAKLMIVDTAVGWLTWGSMAGSQVAVFAGGGRKYGALHGRCNATHADTTVLPGNTIVLHAIYPAVSTARENFRAAGILLGH